MKMLLFVGIWRNDSPTKKNKGGAVYCTAERHTLAK